MSESEKFLYSVEQLELVRRLRNSGLSKDQVLLAFDYCFSRMSEKLASSANCAVLLKPLHQQTVRQQLLYLQQRPPSSVGDVNNHSRPLWCSTTIARGDSVSNGSNEFFSKDEASACEEIKNFIIKNNIKQQQIALLAGVSQPYVSRYLKGDFSSMSDRSCRAIRQWFITYLKNPEAIGPAASVAAQNNPTIKMMSSLASRSSPVAEVFPTHQRRERFVFRASHLEVLERSFIDDNYPSHEMRFVIARQCNLATREMCGRELTPKELISTLTVATWFANKRKDLKRSSRNDLRDETAERISFSSDDHDLFLKIEQPVGSAEPDLDPVESGCLAATPDTFASFADRACDVERTSRGHSETLNIQSLPAMS